MQLKLSHLQQVTTSQSQHLAHIHVYWEKVQMQSSIFGISRIDIESFK